MTKDYYKILNISEYSTSEEIKNAYRHLARKYRAGFVPYVMLLNKNKSQFVSPSCLSDNVCVENAIKKF